MPHAISNYFKSGYESIVKMINDNDSNKDPKYEEYKKSTKPRKSGRNNSKNPCFTINSSALTPKFYFTPEEFSILIKHAHSNSENLNLVSKTLSSALANTNKRSYTEQQQIRETFQLTHGVCLKRIPYTFNRTDVYKSIVALKNQFFNDSNQENVIFPGNLGLMQFMFPKMKLPDYELGQTAFPIFKNKGDKDLLWQCGLKNADKLKEHWKGRWKSGLKKSYSEERVGVLFLTHPRTGISERVVVELIKNEVSDTVRDTGSAMTRTGFILDKNNNFSEKLRYSIDEIRTLKEKPSLEELGYLAPVVIWRQPMVSLNSYLNESGNLITTVSDVEGNYATTLTDTFGNIHIAETKSVEPGRVFHGGEVFLFKKK